MLEISNNTARFNLYSPSFDKYSPQKTHKTGLKSIA